MPVLKVKENGIWESVTGGSSSKHMNGGNADTLDGYHADAFAKTEAVSELENSIQELESKIGTGEVSESDVAVVHIDSSTKTADMNYSEINNARKDGKAVLAIVSNEPMVYLLSSTETDGTSKYAVFNNIEVSGSSIYVSIIKINDTGAASSSSKTLNVASSGNSTETISYDDIPNLYVWEKYESDPGNGYAIGELVGSASEKAAIATWGSSNSTDTEEELELTFTEGKNINDNKLISTDNYFVVADGIDVSDCDQVKISGWAYNHGDDSSTGFQVYVFRDSSSNIPDDSWRYTAVNGWVSGTGGGDRLVDVIVDVPEGAATLRVAGHKTYGLPAVTKIYKSDDSETSIDTFSDIYYSDSVTVSSGEVLLSNQSVISKANMTTSSYTMVADTIAGKFVKRIDGTVCYVSQELTSLQVSGVKVGASTYLCCSNMYIVSASSGNKICYVTSSSKDTYPEDGAQDGYWYRYRKQLGD